MNHMQPPPHAAHSWCVISRQKAAALNHLGILLPNGLVAHCAPGRGEHVSTIEDFAMDQDVTIIEEIPRRLQAATFKRIADAMRSPKDYHATKNNCEMFVNRMLGRAAASPQLNTALIIAGLALIGFAVAA
jgi:hypothetical protein